MKVYLNHAWKQNPWLIGRHQNTAPKTWNQQSCCGKALRITAIFGSNVFSAPQQLGGLIIGGVCGGIGALSGAIAYKVQGKSWKKGCSQGSKAGATAGLIGGTITCSGLLFPLALTSYALSYASGPSKSEISRSNLLINKILREISPLPEATQAPIEVQPQAHVGASNEKTSLDEEFPNLKSLLDSFDTAETAAEKVKIENLGNVDFWSLENDDVNIVYAVQDFEGMGIIVKRDIIGLKVHKIRSEVKETEEAKEEISWIWIERSSDGVWKINNINSFSGEIEVPNVFFGEGLQVLGTFFGLNIRCRERFFPLTDEKGSLTEKPIVSYSTNQHSNREVMQVLETLALTLEYKTDNVIIRLPEPLNLVQKNPTKSARTA